MKVGDVLRMLDKRNLRTLEEPETDESDADEQTEIDSTSGPDAETQRMAEEFSFLSTIQPSL